MSLKILKPLMFIILSLVYMVSFVQAVVMTVVANNIMEDMNLTPAGMGKLGSFYLYGYSGVLLFSGMIVARFGPRWTLSTLCFVSGLGGLLFATSESFMAACLGRMLTGVGLSSNMTSALTIFARWFPGRIYGRLCSVCISIGGMGTLLANLLLPRLNAALGWRNVFFGIGVLTILYGGLVILLVRDWPPDELSPDGGSVSAARAKITVGMLWAGFRAVAKRLDFWRLCVWFGALSGMYFSFAGLWLMPYLKEVYGMSHTEVGTVTSVVAFGSLVGAPLVSWLSDSLLGSYRFSLGMAGVLTVVVNLFLQFRIDSMSITAISTIILMVGMNVNAPTGVAHAATRNLFGTGMAGIVSGILSCSGFLWGASLQILCGELLYFGERLGLPGSQCYAMAFSPFIVCGLLTMWGGFTLSKDSYVHR